MPLRMLGVKAAAALTDWDTRERERAAAFVRVDSGDGDDVGCLQLRGGPAVSLV